MYEMDPLTSQFEDDKPDELNELWNNPGDPDGVFAAERREEIVRAVVDGLTKPLQRRPRPWRLMLAGLALVIIAIVAAYWLGTRHSKPASQAAAAPAKPQPVVTTTQPYTSTLYTLSLSYPANWVISDTTAKLTVTSPPIQLIDLHGPTVGRVVTTIENQQTTVPGFPAKGAMANLPSQQLVYAQPSGVQRDQTYLSFVGYKSPNGLDGLFLTGDTDYKVGQHVSLSDVTRATPFIIVTFVRCTNADCSQTQPTTLLARSWPKAAFNAPITSLLRSLTLN